MAILTIGYEGLTSQQFFQILLRNQVEYLIDVRELPISRKAGFSKSALSETAATYNLQYLHIRELGSPRNIRHQYREDGDWDTYTRQFLGYLATQQEVLADLAELVQQHRCCLLCFEKDHHFCHRSYVAEHVSELVGEDISIVHLPIRNQVEVVEADLLAV